MTASTTSLSTGTLANLGLSSSSANAGTAMASPSRGQADASSAKSDDSFRKLLGQGTSTEKQNDAQVKGKTTSQAPDNDASSAARTDDGSQAQTPASTNAADAPAAKTVKADDEKDDAVNATVDDGTGSPDATQAIWVAGLPLPGLPATPTPMGGAIQSFTAEATATSTSSAGLQATAALTPRTSGMDAPPIVTTDGNATDMPPALITTDGNAIGIPPALVTTDGNAADMPPALIATTTAFQTTPDADAPGEATSSASAKTASQVTTATAQSTAQAVSNQTSLADTSSASKTASATLAAIAPALVQPLQAGDAGKNADAIDLAAFGLVSTGAQPAQATLQPATSVFPPTLPTADLDAGQFDEAIGARLTWMADQKIGHAHIKVSPEGMGQIDVQMKLDGSRVHADFNANQPEVRHALESSLPRLREMLDQQGFQLTQANVGQGQQQSSNARQSSAEDGSQNGASAQAGSTGADNGAASATLQLPAHGLGLLDTYA